MGPDRHLVCWEISLDRSERLPSPLPAPAHQMSGEGHILAPCAAWVHLLAVFSHTGRHKVCRSTNTEHCCLGINFSSLFRILPHLCSSPPSPLLLSTILQRSDATRSFCWSVRLRLGSCSWQALLSDRLNSRYGTNACWSSSQYSRLHGTYQ